jgi:uncharacterized membrane protein YvlD (DUF360 family)
MVGRLRVSDLARMVLAWAISALALIVADAWLADLSATTWLDWVAAAAVTGVFGVLIRPALSNVAAFIGWAAVGLLAITGQALVMLLAFSVVPGIAVGSFWTAVAASWIAATVGTVLTWLVTAGTDEAFTVALRGGRRASVPDPEVDGVVFVQLDGLPFPVAQWALQSGTMPTLRRWVDGGSHRFQGWTVQLPCTTPASQQGILHGSCAGVPAFRWYDRELGRVLVANRPADAAVIEQRASTGHGLLADDGVSISNLFSGDAQHAQMTMSRVTLSRGSTETRRAVARFVIRPDGLARSVAHTLGEIARERFQAHRQRRRDVRPRVRRSWTFALLRAISNAVMRDLNTALVAQAMHRGARSVYVDFVDYDEVAHHAGGNRIEALSVLAALDQRLSLLEAVAATAPRRYRFVVLSDHGQSQGAPFAEQFGDTLGELCAQLVDRRVVSIEDSVESWGRVESLLDDLAGQSRISGQTVARAASRLRRHTAPQDDQESADELVVLGSGNLGLVYARRPRRLSLEEIEARWPALVPGLAAHPGVGFVAALSRTHGPVVIGADGYRRLADGTVEGLDPLAPFGAHAAGVLERAVRMHQAPDLYVNSTVDPATLEVAAFEDLVGCHGGLGGWQDHGVLIVPADLVPDGAEVTGAEALHRLLVGMLERLGQRRELQRAAAETDRDVVG